MDTSHVLEYATLVSVLIGIGIIFARGIISFFRNRVRGALKQTSLEEALATMNECKTDIKFLGKMTESINGVVVNMDKYGSKGAMEGIKKLWRKIHVMNERLYRVESKLNGGDCNTPRSPEDDEEF